MGPTTMGTAMTSIPTRREFLKTGALAAAAIGLPELTKPARAAVPIRKTPAKSCIFINLVGGPSQLDTWDPKPDAPSNIRGPFAPIRTTVPGVQFSELFPKMAANAHRFSLLRGMHHTAPPIHETGFQLLNTGHLFRDGPEWPNVGAVVAYLLGERDRCSPWWVMSASELATGIAVSHGQGTGFLNYSNELIPRPRLNTPGEMEWDFDISANCAAAAVRYGARFVTLNMYSTVFDSVSWDCHADRGSLATTLGDYQDTVAPTFDHAFTGLLDHLESRGLLESTLVVATGEFGRTPKLNSNGGRDHWAGCWTALMAGGGVQGGRVVGASDATGSEPTNRPVTPQEFVATIYHALGIEPNATIPGPDGMPVAVYPGTPVVELF